MEGILFILIRAEFKQMSKKKLRSKIQKTSSISKISDIFLDFSMR